MSRLVLKNLHKKHHDKIILNDLNLSIEKGEFIVIVGPSGCGKSTLLRLVAGLEELTSGDIILDDKIINDVSPKDRNMAMVFQNYALYPHMRVYDNMAYGLKRRGFPKDEIKTRIADVAKMLDISELLERKPQQLSGGQKQRVAMGRAIVRRPKLYLFDEPLSNLDAKLRIQMRLEIKKLHKTFNITSLYVTHDQLEAMTLADRLIVLNKGNIEQIGKPLEIYQKPASTFVGGFIGSPIMNFLPVTISADGKNIILNGAMQIPLRHNIPQHYFGQTVILGIRPENIYLTKEAEHIIPFQVNLTEPLGAQTILYGTILGTQSLTILHPKPEDIPDENIISIAFDLKKIHLFDQETKKNILTS